MPLESISTVGKKIILFLSRGTAFPCGFVSLPSVRLSVLLFLQICKIHVCDVMYLLLSCFNNDMTASFVQ